MRSLKAISPLVAVILLIAFTLIVAGILAGWATQFATIQTEVLEKCTNARLVILDARLSGSTLTLVLNNQGSVDLDFVVLLTYPSSTHDPPIEQYSDDSYNVTAGEIRTFALSSVEDDLEMVTISSKVCPGITTRIQKAYIKGL